MGSRVGFCKRREECFSSFFSYLHSDIHFVFIQRIYAKVTFSQFSFHFLLVTCVINSFKIKNR